MWSCVFPRGWSSAQLSQDETVCSPGWATLSPGDLVCCQAIRHGDAPPLDVPPFLADGAVGSPMLAIGQPVAGFQVAQGEGAVDGAVDNGSALLRDGLPVAHVEADKGRHIVKALLLKKVLDAGMALAGLDRHLVDLEVEGLIAPAACQHVVTQAGERVADEEVAVPLHKAL